MRKVCLGDASRASCAAPPLFGEPSAVPWGNVSSGRHFKSAATSRSKGRKLLDSISARNRPSTPGFAITCSICGHSEVAARPRT